MVRRVRDGLTDLAREVLDRPLALREHIDDLGPVAVAQRLRDGREGSEERVLRRPLAHLTPFVETDIQDIT